MKKLASVIIMGVVIFSLGLPIITQAQDGGDLTEEEIVLIERISTVEAILDEFSSYSFNRFESENSAVSFGEQANTTDKWLRRYGYMVKDGETENAQFHGFFYEYGYPESVVIEGDVRQIDDIIYVNALIYTQAEEGAESDTAGIKEPLTVGWEVIESEEDIPLTLDSLQLDELFEDEPVLLFDQDLLLTYADSATSSEVEVMINEENVLVENILVTVTGANFLPFYSSVIDSEELDNPSTQAIFNEDLVGLITLSVQYLPDGTIYSINSFMNIENTTIDAHAIDPNSFSEGDLLSFTATYGQEMIYLDINSDFASIEIPKAE